MKSLSKIALAAALCAVASGSLGAGSAGVEHTSQAFLEALERGGGKPLHTLSPTDARAVLVGAQAWRQAGPSAG